MIVAGPHDLIEGLGMFEIEYHRRLGRCDVTPTQENQKSGGESPHSLSSN